MQGTCDIDLEFQRAGKRNVPQAGGETVMEAIFFCEMSFLTWVWWHQESSSDHVLTSLASMMT